MCCWCVYFSWGGVTHARRVVYTTQTFVSNHLHHTVLLLGTKIHRTLAEFCSSFFPRYCNAPALSAFAAARPEILCSHEGVSTNARLPFPDSNGFAPPFFEIRTLPFLSFPALALVVCVITFSFQPYFAVLHILLSSHKSETGTHCVTSSLRSRHCHATVTSTSLICLPSTRGHTRVTYSIALHLLSFLNLPAETLFSNGFLRGPPTPQTI